MLLRECGDELNYVSGVSDGALGYVHLCAGQILILALFLLHAYAAVSGDEFHVQYTQTRNPHNLAP